MNFSEYYPDYFTATILGWKHLLKPDKYKDIIVSSLDFLVKEKRIVVYGFVIMSNHIHLVCLPRLNAGANSTRLSIKRSSPIIHEIYLANDH